MKKTLTETPQKQKNELLESLLGYHIQTPEGDVIHITYYTRDSSITDSEVWSIGYKDTKGKVGSHLNFVTIKDGVITHYGQPLKILEYESKAKGMEGTKGMLQYIEVSKIEPHPDNPRKELGDLSELAESIKANGILQNLTVVPWFDESTHAPVDIGKMDGYYRVVIGHRRLAAAKLAGIKEVPCIISNMDYKEQVATMLLENMQRSDLTVYEQAQGFQMMLDLGESVDNIADRTGFSQSTVRRRVKLLELDQGKLKESAARGATLQDYLELEKIENIELRNKVLGQVGTSNFKYALQQAIDKENRDKNMAWLIGEVEKFAKKIENSSGMRHVKSYYSSQKDDFEVPKDADTVEYFFVASDYGYVELYTKYVEQGSNNTEVERQKRTRERKAALDEITKRAYKLRQDFIKKYSGTKAKKNAHIIMEYFIRYAINEYQEMDTDMLLDILGIEAETDDDDDLNFDVIFKKFSISPEYVFLVAVYCTLDCDGKYYTWDGTYCENTDLNLLYDFLVKLGYEMSDDEKELRNGTHKIFKIVSGS